MACTVSSSSSRVSGFTVWDRTAVVPGAKRYWLGLGGVGGGFSTWAHHMAHPLLAAPYLPCYCPILPVVPHLPCSYLSMGFVGELNVLRSLAPVPIITHASTLPPEPRSPRIPAVMASTSSSCAASSCDDMCVRGLMDFSGITFRLQPRGFVHLEAQIAYHLLIPRLLCFPIPPSTPSSLALVSASLSPGSLCSQCPIFTNFSESLTLVVLLPVLSTQPMWSWCPIYRLTAFSLLGLRHL